MVEYSRVTEQPRDISNQYYEQDQQREGYPGGTHLRRASGGIPQHDYGLPFNSIGIRPAKQINAKRSTNVLLTQLSADVLSIIA